MAALIDTMAYSGEVPWHGLGRQISPDLTPEEMLVAAGLDWKVRMVPLSVEFNGKYENLDYTYALQRMDNGRVLSVTSDKYKPVQNDDAMDFFCRFTKDGNMKMETAGSLDNGKFIWALAKIDASFKLPGRDEMLAYLLLMQPHKLGHAMVIDFTGIRVVCWNTLNMALGSSLRGSARAFRMPHLQVFDKEMKEKAAIALGLATTQFSQLQEAAEMLSKVRIANDNELQAYFDQVEGFDRKYAEEHGDDEPRIMAKYRYAYDAGPGSNMQSASGTYWGALNSVTYVVDHHSGRMDDTRLKGAWLGAGAVRKRKALETAITLAQAA